MEAVQTITSDAAHALSTRNIATQQRQPRQPIDHLFPNHKQSIHLLAGAFISVSGKTQKGVQVAQITGVANRGDYTVTVRHCRTRAIGWPA